ncbi:DUF3263 domain-containing protein [Microbacterium trichothecenolyticum]|uniref:DUF3263 domain-containing protein n=1 Tax=Microbacterium trichothecenolyticum TaxID=69370 RepID=UPI001C6ED099|nr:DUF3263 domain-containing protein [Microbacterium trichothecenolyticum]MBW9118865.1 DUF3263 domain-containing protein [Microbacterium trichothecenolyticum]
MTAPAPAELLAFEGKHLQHTGRKETAIRDELHITPARFYQLLGRLIWTEEALQIDPMLTNRLRKRSMDRQAQQQRQTRR